MPKATTISGRITKVSKQFEDAEEIHVDQLKIPELETFGYGRYLHYLRDHYKIRRDFLAKEVGLNPSYFTRLENESRFRSIETA